MRKEIVAREEEIAELSIAERSRKRQLEQIVIKGARTFVEVGNALMEIRDRELYRKDAPTFELYAKRFFDFGKSRTHQLMDAAQVMNTLQQMTPSITEKSTIVDFSDSSQESNQPNKDENNYPVIDMLPINESSIRPMVKFKNNPTQLKTIWQAVTENAVGGKITGRLVDHVVKDYMGDKIEKAIRQARNDRKPLQVGAEFQQKFDALSDQIIAERKAGYKITPREVIIRHLDQLRHEMAEDGISLQDQVFDDRDANKLLRAGYRLFRANRASLTITENGGSAWVTHSGPFSTIRAMEEELSNLLKDDKNLLG
jgi:hypothetical protein